jgi:pimeloyl-ACP methyl ester carboxylesterase
MHRLIQQSTLAMIPGAGHMANLQAPQPFNAAINRLLSRISTPRSVVM